MCLFENILAGNTDPELWKRKAVYLQFNNVRFPNYISCTLLTLIISKSAVLTISAQNMVKITGRLWSLQVTIVKVV